MAVVGQVSGPRATGTMFAGEHRPQPGPWAEAGAQTI